MDRIQDIELIEQYLQNTLPEKDRQALEERLRTQEDLAQEFEKRQVAHRALDYLIAQNLKEHLRSLEAGEAETEEDSGAKVIDMSARRRKRWIYGLSAAASVLLLISIFWVMSPGELQPAALAEAYYEIPAYTGSRGGNTTGNEANDYNQAIQEMEGQNYGSAIELLKTISEEHSLYVPATYYLAHAYYLSGQFELAENSFNIVTSRNDLRYQEEAEWFGLLACLQQNADCRGHLATIAGNASHPYHEKALEIQSRLQ